MSVMMDCGHASMARHENAHDGFDGPHPSCVIHESCTVVEAPDLTGRTARCAYWKSPKNEPVTTPFCTKGGCSCELPSSSRMAFFNHFPNQEFDQYYCGCWGWD